MDYHVYRLIDPRDGLPFYVGLTRNLKARLSEHLYNVTTNEEKVERIQAILSSDLEPLMEVIETLTTHKEGLQREEFWILHYLMRGFPLTNVMHKSEPDLMAFWEMPVSSFPLKNASQTSFNTPEIPQKKAIGWLRLFEIEEAWERFLDGKPVNEVTMTLFYLNFSSSRIPILRPKDYRELCVWYETSLWRLQHPNNPPCTIV